MDNDWYVYVVETESGKAVEEMGPMSQREAIQTRRGVEINLNWDDYHVDIDEGRRSFNERNPS